MPHPFPAKLKSRPNISLHPISLFVPSTIMLNESPKKLIPKEFVGSSICLKLPNQ